ncbi:hypothetical protein ABT009_22755 [Streptomyces sp. NPDC002896]|uniref:hypothetical protein n=1 Tax=Streptomyces sp. NPDC002896 TaxID=3154438 RepID=UPI00332AA465
MPITARRTNLIWRTLATAATAAPTAVLLRPASAQAVPRESLIAPPTSTPTLTLDLARTSASASSESALTRVAPPRAGAHRIPGGTD